MPSQSADLCSFFSDFSERRCASASGLQQMERERQLQEPCIQGLPCEAKTGLVAAVAANPEGGLLVATSEQHVGM